ncbi:serine/threonine-protein kinase [Prosthecobacter sp.]|uniref:WD40 repeat domain-containing serine/threonine protein kinase n=1 Tax=Prosthecobacter sp. TaxID=1965333 RepID=UPI002AB90613|nr:serine/threonine-protein kinase [Prosthecobacter sp.]MDZ4401913.1 serine/threonine-protein kinase [Prosthecobacter sp.]
MSDPAPASSENFTDALFAQALEADDAKTIIDHHSPGRIYEQPGQVIGRYTLVEVLGEGGFGSVWRAEQSKPVARQVALKIIKLGMDTREVIARFEQERQALAIMDHPNIARVFDAGVTDAGRPYFVMELVKGEPLTTYCDRNRLTIRQRLELFIQVCQAIQHAHQKGVIHRDLKPSNILVSEHDDAPVVRVIDFGVAKATERSLTAETLQTLAGQVIGTPGYMSPEQADPLHQDIDTRSDVYSLGAVLYELLTGTLPLDDAGFVHVALEAILRRIREQDPPRPSNRITSLAADQQATAAQRRGMESTRLPHAVRGDLDWIVMKCLEKDRQRRYETVSGLAADVQRHLNDEPITARPPSAAYRIRKTVRRNRLAFGAAAVITVSLIAGLVGTSMGLVRARRAQAAEAERADGERRAKEQLASEKARQDELLWKASRSDHEAAVRAFYEHRNGEGLAYIDRALEYRPMNTTALAASAANAFGTSAPIWRTRSVSAFAGVVNCIAFSPDGRYLAAGSEDNTVRVIEAATGKEMSKAKFGDQVWSVSFSPEGRSFAAGSADKTARVIEVATGKEMSKAEFGAAVTSVSFSPDGRHLATGNSDKTVRVVEVASGKEISRMVFRGSVSISRAEFGGSVTSVSFSPDGRHLAAGCSDKTARVIEAASGKEISRAEFGGSVTSVNFSPDGRHLAAGSADKTVRVIEAASGKEISRAEFGGSVTSVNFSPDGRHLAAGSADKTARVIEAASGKEISRAEFGGSVTSVSFSPDGRYLAAGCSDKTARVIEATTTKEISKADFGGLVTSVSFSPDGRYLAAGSSDKTARVIEVASGKEICTVEFDGPVKSLSLSPNGRYLAAGCRGNSVLVIEAVSGKEISRAEFGGSVTSVSFSPAGRHLAVGCSDFTARVTEVASGKEISRAEFGGSVTSVSFSPDGRYLAAGSADKTVRVIEAASGKEISRTEFGGSVTSVNFSPDGRHFAVGCSDFTARVIDCTCLGEVDAAISQEWSAALSLASGLRFQSNEQLHPVPANELAHAQDVVHAFVARPPNDGEYWQHAILKWSQMLPEDRTTSPWTDDPIRTAIGRWLIQARIYTPTITDCADQAPWHPLVPVSLARKETLDIQDAAQRKVRTTFLARLTLKRLRDADVNIYSADVLTAYAAKAADWMLELALPQEAAEARALKW